MRLIPRRLELVEDRRQRATRACGRDGARRRPAQLLELQTLVQDLSR